MLPEVIKPGGASERALRMLNGSSRGSTTLWDFSPGDYIVGTVTERTVYEARFNRQATTRLVLSVEEGSEAGRPIPFHAHRVLICMHQELRRMLSRLDPQEGDVLAAYYAGRDDPGAGKPSRHLWRYGLDRGDAAADEHKEF